MRYTPINLTKPVKDTQNNVFNIDWIQDTGRSPFTKLGVVGPVSDIKFFYNDILNNITASASKIFLVITPNTLTRIHFVMAVMATNNVKYIIYEGTTVSANGTTLTPFNNDRNDATTATLSVFQDPTITSNGTAIKTDTNIGQNSRLDEITHVNELILAQNTTYGIQVANLTSSTVSALTKFFWAEVT